MGPAGAPGRRGRRAGARIKQRRPTGWEREMEAAIAASSRGPRKFPVRHTPLLLLSSRDPPIVHHHSCRSAGKRNFEGPAHAGRAAGLGDNSWACLRARGSWRLQRQSPRESIYRCACRHQGPRTVLAGGRCPVKEEHCGIQACSSSNNLTFLICCHRELPHAGPASWQGWRWLDFREPAGTSSHTGGRSADAVLQACPARSHSPARRVLHSSAASAWRVSEGSLQGGEWP